MNGKNKFLYYFLIIITFGFILIYWKKKYRQNKQKDYLSKSTKISFDLEDMIRSLGGKENIKSTSSTQKILKIFFDDKQKVNALELKKLDGVSGIALQSQSISLVLGNTAKYVEELINNEVK
ncbi:PTS glucose transporter subunit IIB [Mycoplasma enhydrae]|uniref:PTS glucose transporter subunit IIB n=1 Tax=Mycoplasma enhydrae TaxID=2499220 RepID=UPI00197C1D30|nr:PTS glucose transporter subunit IIB [Mycoplasma enhydrae]MBN4089261.1 PTS glucose transporter subunit IIB [Mycoplasma enhydrae]MCV3733579.1 PTS glucose transporter subunit IIB [Mycoplasma enhydrae]MCV3753445.1 PTS glucose transporter subunit IIB [Mycoplasma enhydrae]